MNDSAKNSKLGRGLFDLMEESAAAKTITPLSSGGLMRLPVSAIQLGPWQARLTTEWESIEQLAQSIRDRGILHPILVRRAGEGFELIAGRRRLEAAQSIGLQEIPALVQEATDQQCAELFFIENLQRKELPAEYRNKAADELAQHFGLTPVQQKDLLRLELPVPLPPPPAIELPPPAPVAVEPLPAPEEAPEPLPEPIAMEKPRYPWLALAAVAVAAFLLGAGAWRLVSERPAEVQVASAPVAEPPPAPPAAPELLAPGTHPLEADRSVTVFDQPVFQYGIVISETARKILLDVAEAMKALPNTSFTIVGHTSPDPLPNTEVYADNYALGLARAEAVFHFLRTEGGVPAERLTVATRGGDNPPWPLDEPGARAKNRTVTIEQGPQ